jgi:hypothetical protein
MGESLHGATRDWAIVDVPPGTERVRMEGAGGGAAEVTWSKYSGVRRAQFLPDGTPASARRPSEKVVVPEPPKERERERERERDTRVSVSIYDERERERERDPPPPKKEKKSDMWTEITKDLVTRDAIEELGYEYEETEYFYYILQYLRYVCPFPISLPILSPTYTIMLTRNRRTSSSSSNYPTVSVASARIVSARLSGSVSIAMIGTDTIDPVIVIGIGTTRVGGMIMRLRRRLSMIAGRRLGDICVRLSKPTLK